MKMLTIRQPWASLIAHGVKTIETRPFSTAYRGPLAIHAGKAWPVPVGEWQVPHDRGPGPYIERLIDNPVTALRRWESIPTPLGAVVAVVDLIDVVPIFGGDQRVAPKVEAAGGSYIADLRHEGPLPHQQGGLWLIGPNQLTTGTPTSVEDQAPFGDFTPGRFAWLLDNVHAVEPIPAKGHQGLRDAPHDVWQLLTHGVQP